MFTGIVTKVGHVRHTGKRGDIHAIREARNSGEGSS
jgi:riboflavin synthase alpha subunit